MTHSVVRQRNYPKLVYSHQVYAIYRIDSSKRKYPKLQCSLLPFQELCHFPKCQRIEKKTNRISTKKNKLHSLAGSPRVRLVAPALLGHGVAWQTGALDLQGLEGPHEAGGPRGAGGVHLVVAGAWGKGNMLFVFCAPVCVNSRSGKEEFVLHLGRKVYLVVCLGVDLRI